MQTQVLTYIRSQARLCKLKGHTEAFQSSEVYRIIVKLEKQGKKTVYNAYCPTLGVTDYGNSQEEVLKSIKDGIELALDYLVKEGKQTPAFIF